MDVDTHTARDISELAVKEIWAYISGLLTVPNVQRAKKDSLVEYILAKADPSCIEHLWKAGQERRAERDRNRENADIGRKWKRNEQQNTHHVVQRIDHDSTEAHDSDSDQSDPSLNSFLQLPTPAQLKGCYCAFYNATSNKALASTTCGICACNVNINEQKVAHFEINSLPNAHWLIPRNPHLAHTLFDGKLLEPRGVRNEGSDSLVMACKNCISSLNKPKDVPPEYSHQQHVLSFVFKTFVSTLEEKEVFPQNSDLSSSCLIVSLHFVFAPLHPHTFALSHTSETLRRIAPSQTSIPHHFSPLDTMSGDHFTAPESHPSEPHRIYT